MAHSFGFDIAQLDKNIQQLQAKAQELTGKISSLDTEQKSKVEMGNQLLQKSESAKGQESLDLFKQSASVRQSAAIVARDLEYTRTDLARTDALFADAQSEGELRPELSPRRLAETLTGAYMLAVANWLIGWWPEQPPLHDVLHEVGDTLLRGALCPTGARRAQGR